MDESDNSDQGDQQLGLGFLGGVFWTSKTFVLQQFVNMLGVANGAKLVSRHFCQRNKSSFPKYYHISY